MSGRLCSILLLLTAGAALGAVPAMRVVKAASAGTPLLANGSFESVREGKASPWGGWQQGYRVAPEEGRGGSQCVVCERRESDGERGASQTLTLNRTNLAPFIIRGWSKAEEVSGSPDSGYSLYVDIVYADGTPLWGQTADFSCGTHDWEKREFVVVPDKPVRVLTLHCLFRGHTGKVWFDDASVEEVQAPAGAVLFQSVPLKEFTSVNEPATAQRTLSTRDGLRLGLRGTAVSSLQVGGKELGDSSASGFLARDYAADSDFYGFRDGAGSDLGLKLDAEFNPSSDHITVSGRLTDTTGRDRAVTLLFALPLDATGWQWGDDVRRSRRIEGNVEFANVVTLHCGANGKMSLYPLAAIWNDRAGLAMALDMEHPAQYRLVYHARTKQLFIAYDFGLSKDTKRFPGSAEFRFIIYCFDPHWGFRAALQKYYDIFPQCFTKRVTREGVWMPFTDIAKVPGHEDFGFAFQEGAPNVAFDDQHGIASFVYVEPMSHWLAMPRDVPRTYESALTVLTNDLNGARGKDAARMASATLTSGVENANGQLYLHLMKAPWCDGGVFTLNPDPDIATTPERPFNKATAMRQAIEDAFRKNEPKQGQTGVPPSREPGRDAFHRVPVSPEAWGRGGTRPYPPPEPGLDGVYLDSLEMACSELNYRREHFRTARVPLVFDHAGRPCQLMMFNTWAFERDIAAQMHAQGKLLFANGALWQFSFPAPCLDVLGTEVNWLRNGEYRSDPDAVMCFRRAMCRQKPYCLLMNTDYSRFTPELVERYFQRCLFYGVWPGFFDEEAASKDPYWASAKHWYERDRSLFKKYIPLLRRVTAAGWQPLTHAMCSSTNIMVERFGPQPSGEVFLTLLNDTPEPQSGMLTLDQKALGLKRGTAVRELVSGSPAIPCGRLRQVSLRPQQVEVLSLSFQSN